jgi:hypothetical protein
MSVRQRLREILRSEESGVSVNFALIGGAVAALVLLALLAVETFG